MVSTVVDLFEDNKYKKPNTKEEEERVNNDEKVYDHYLRKQVININGEIVTI